MKKLLIFCFLTTGCAVFGQRLFRGFVEWLAGGWRVLVQQIYCVKDSEYPGKEEKAASI